MYLRSDTIRLADIFENFRKNVSEIYQLDPAKFLSASVLAWQTALKKTEVKLELLADVDMLLMVEKSIRGGICHSINRYIKDNNKYTKYYNNNKKSLYLKYLDVNTLYSWAVSQKLPLITLDGLKIFPNLMEAL